MENGILAVIEIGKSLETEAREEFQTRKRQTFFPVQGGRKEETAMKLEDLQMGESNIVKKIASYIENHLEEDLSLDKIAEELHYSKYYLARVFTEKTGCTIYKYIQGRRLTLAARELVETKKPIIEIACDAHYSSQQAFTLAFEQLYLCTPQVYRKRGTFYPKQSGIDMQSAQSVSFRVYGKYPGRGPMGYALASRVPAGSISMDYTRGGVIAA